jgi:hypothetical protein
VSDAENDLEFARDILRNIPSVWHRFNLTYFETEVQRGITNVQKAENETKNMLPTATPPTKASGFELIYLVLSLLAVYVLKRQ